MACQVSRATRGKQDCALSSDKFCETAVEERAKPSYGGVDPICKVLEVHKQANELVSILEHS